MGILADIVSAPYNAVTGQQTSLQMNAEQQDEQDSIQSVADNASTYYGADSSTAQIAQSVADDQEAQAASDQTTLAALQATDKGACPSGGLNLNGIGFGCVSSVNDLLSQLNTLTHIGLAVVGVLIVGWLGITFGPTLLAVTRKGGR